MGRAGHLAGPLEEAIFAAELNRVIGPVASSFGWHLTRWRRSDAVGRVPSVNAAGRSRSSWPSTVGTAPGWPGWIGEWPWRSVFPKGLSTPCFGGFRAPRTGIDRDERSTQRMKIGIDSYCFHRFFR